LTPLPGSHPTKPGSATFPFFGIKFDVLDPNTGTLLEGNDVTGVGVISQPWPSIARTVYNDHSRYLTTYMRVYKGFYFTGDGVTRDKDGYLWINGRVDDVINVSGHRLGTAEIESALVSHSACAEAAVIGIPHDIKGQGIFAYCILKHGYEESEDLAQQLKQEVRNRIGAFATPGTKILK
jgi:acetyl-CoA synthetase